jgi:hypothetical protein
MAVTKGLVWSLDQGEDRLSLLDDVGGELGDVGAADVAHCYPAAAALPRRLLLAVSCLAEGEGVGLDAGVEEGDLEGPLADGKLSVRSWPR